MPPSMSAPDRQSAWPPYVESRAKSQNAAKSAVHSGIQGVWENGVFRFHSPEAMEAWRRKAYQQGVSENNWHLGQEVDDQTRDLVQANLGGPMPAMYQGPDGKHRFVNFHTIEDEATRDHRLQYLQGKTIDQIAATMPGEDEWIEQQKTKQGLSGPLTAANDNQGRIAASAGVAGMATHAASLVPINAQTEQAQSEKLASVPYGGRFSAMPKPANDPSEGFERPGLGDRFGTAAKRALVDGTIFGNVVQQFRSGHAVSPDTLATRPPNRFSQLGSRGALLWYDMYAPLGIAGGKRKVDLLPPEERKQWQTEWEALSADQQAAYRTMWEEKQKDYLPWRAKFDRDTTLPPPESKTEYAVDILGSMAGSMASPENWIGMGPGAAANTARSVRSFGLPAEVAGRDLISESTTAINQVLGSTVKASGSTGKPAWQLQPNIYTPVFTEAQARRLTGERRGIALVVEKMRGTPEAKAFEEATTGRIKDVETRNTLSPGLMYHNSNPTGRHIVKFDGQELADDGTFVFLIDAKKRFAYFNAGARRDTEDIIRRWTEALDQNPGYRVIVEFPNKMEMLIARAVFRNLNVNERIFARVRQHEE